MYKVFFSLYAAVTIIGANELKDFEVYASLIEQNATDVKIEGKILINYDKKIMTANSGRYKINDKKLFLEGNVTILDELGKKINAKLLEINLDNNKIKFKDFFSIDDKNIWMGAIDAIKQDNNITLQNAVFSSCKLKNPDWKITFDKAIYDTKDKDLKLYNAKIFIKDIPFFYTPYFYLPLSKERKSGFLFPILTYVNNEGFLYAQPYFWAISKSKDLEVVAQIRSDRGYGLYATYRFVDNIDSFGKIKLGYFNDKNSYTSKYNLRYKEHYGIEFYYKNNSFINKLNDFGFENKLYINALYFNDEDYLNLQLKDKINHHKIGSFYESRLNYYIKNDYFFSGIYFSYFQDATKTSNDETLQILPKLQFHLPYTNLIFNNLSYSLDATITNYTRDSGTKAFKAKIKLPVVAHFSLFSGFLHIDLTHELEATAYDFYNVPISQKKYSSIVLNHTLSVSNEMAKAYTSGMHISFLEATYTKTSILSENWMKYNQIPQELKVNFVDDIPFESKVTLRTHQYWKSYENSGLNIDYILEAHYYPKEGKFRDLNSKLKLNYKNWFFKSELGYSFLHKQTTDVSNTIGYNTSKYGLSLSALWKKDYLSFETLSKEIALSGYYNYSNNLKFNTKIAYNIKDKSLKEWRLGAYINRDCWDAYVTIGQDIKPVIKSDGSRGSISNNYIKVQFKILPFGG